MIYTIGSRENYLNAIENSDGGYIEKLGRYPRESGEYVNTRPDGYVGGTVVQTFEDALRLLDTMPGAYCIWGVDANWETDTVPSKNGWWHDLLYDSRIISLEKFK